MKHVVSVSMPRSGHHLFEMILHNTLEDRFHYCEFYGDKCCKQIPCRSVADFSKDGAVFLQKSHDFALSDPTEAENAIRVVQYRAPVPRTLSNYELYLNTESFKKSGASDTVEIFKKFLISEAVYFVRFYNKWIRGNDSKFYFLSYERLTGDPYKAIKGFFDFSGLDVPYGAILEGIQKSLPKRGRDGTAYSHNNIYSHRYIDLPELAAFESLIIDHCEGYFPTRQLQATDARSSYIGLSFQAHMSILNDEFDLAATYLEQASKITPSRKSVSADLERLKYKLGKVPKPNVMQRLFAPLFAKAPSRAIGSSAQA